MLRALFRPLAGVVVLSFCLVSTPSLYAEPVQNFNSKVFLEEPPEGKRAPLFWKQPTYPKIPEFMKYWEFGATIGEHRGPRYFMDLIIPLYQADAGDRTLFFEPRYNYADSDMLLNLGLGYRQLVRDRTWMLGTNMFYDWESESSHYRFGGGFEAISSVVELRANGYLGLSPERVSESGLAANTVQEAADGYDLELGFPVPYYSRLKFFGKFEMYEFERFNNRRGWGVRAEYTPTPAVVVDVTLNDTNKQEPAWGLTVALRPPFWSNRPTKEDVRSVLKLDKVMFPDSDVGERLYIPVERHHEIVVESFNQINGQVTVEIVRNN